MPSTVWGASCFAIGPTIRSYFMYDKLKKKIDFDHNFEFIHSLAGHTHGGQFLILAPFAWLINPFFKGHYELPNGSQVYVSTGVYFWGKIN